MFQKPEEITYKNIDNGRNRHLNISVLLTHKRLILLIPSDVQNQHSLHRGNHG